MPGSRYDLEVVLGETLEESFELYADDDATVPFDLTGWTVEITLEPYNLGENPPVVLKAGTGLTIGEPKNGNIALKHDIAAPVFDVGLGSWSMKLTSPAGAVMFPLAGWLTVGGAP